VIGVTRLEVREVVLRPRVVHERRRLLEVGRANRAHFHGQVVRLRAELGGRVGVLLRGFGL
jgi:hypothetical protein